MKKKGAGYKIKKVLIGFQKKKKRINYLLVFENLIFGENCLDNQENEPRDN